MKTRHIKLTAALLALVLVVAPKAQAQVIVSLGLNFNSVSDVDFGSRDATFDNKTGWHAGLAYDFALGPLGVRAGVRYMDAGALYEDSFEGIPNIDDKVSINLLEFPVDLRFRFNAPIITPYVMAGPVVRIPVVSDDGFKDSLESLSVAGGVGAGLEVGLAGFQLFPEIRYTFGISRFLKEDFELGGRTFTASDDQRLNAFMISLGIGI